MCPANPYQSLNKTKIYFMGMCIFLYNLNRIWCACNKCLSVFLCAHVCYLLLAEFSLDLMWVAGLIDDGPREFSLNVSQPGAQTAHVLIQLLHCHQSLLQLLYPTTPETQATYNNTRNTNDNTSKLKHYTMQYNTMSFCK